MSSSSAETPPAEVAGLAGSTPPPGTKPWMAVLRSFVALAVGEGAGRLFGLFAVILLARRLGADNFGLITIGLAAISWFAIVVDSGTELMTIRDVSRNPTRFRELADRVVGLRLAVCSAAIVLYVIGVFALSRSVFDRDVLLRFGLVLPAIALNLRWMVLGVRGAKAVAIGNTLARAAILAGVVLFVSGRGDVVRVPYLEAVGEVVYGVVIIAIVARRFGFVRPKIDLEAWRAMLRGGVPLMISGAARTTVITFDVILIGLALGPGSAGNFGAAARVSAFVAATIGLFSVSFLSAYSASDHAQAVGLARWAGRLLFPLGLVVALVLSLGSTVIVPLLYRHGYSSAEPVLSVVAWSIPLSALQMPYATALIAGHRQRVLMRNSVAVAVFMIVADSIAIPLGGIVAAAGIRIASSALGLLLNSRSAVEHGLAPPLSEMLALPRLARRSAAQVAD
jgi:O-antigen/teichoic acid export membrane protein